VIVLISVTLLPTLFGGEVPRTSVQNTAAERFDSAPVQLNGCGWKWEDKHSEMTAGPEHIPSQRGRLMLWENHGLGLLEVRQAWI
jgi:hypothetical protein